MPQTIKAVVVREGDNRTTVVEFPEPIGVVERQDPDGDWMPDGPTIERVCYQHAHVRPTSVEFLEMDAKGRMRYLVTLP